MKRLSIILFILGLTSFVALSQEHKYQLSSHILDITRGEGAPGIKIALSKMDSRGAWQVLEEKTTDQNGRIKEFLKEELGKQHRGVYKLSYYTEPYFTELGQKSFYPFIEVVFEIQDDSHYHVPITLSPYGYSTYRGN